MDHSPNFIDLYIVVYFFLYLSICHMSVKNKFIFLIEWYLFFPTYFFTFTSFFHISSIYLTFQSYLMMIIYIWKNIYVLTLMFVWFVLKYTLYIDAHSVELNSLPTVKTAANLFKTLCYDNKDRLLAGIIVAVTIFTHMHTYTHMYIWPTSYQLKWYSDVLIFQKKRKKKYQNRLHTFLYMYLYMYTLYVFVMYMYGVGLGCSKRRNCLVRSIR